MKKKIWVNKTTSYKEAEEFDIKFWKQAGANARFVAAWSMLTDYYKMRGKRVIKLRLRRSVQNIERS